MKNLHIVYTLSACFYCVLTGGGTAAFADTITLDDYLSRPQDTTTLTFLGDDNTLKFADGTTLDMQTESGYTIVATDKLATDPNVFTKSVYDPDTKTVSSQNYEIVVDPYFEFSGANSVTTNVLNGGTFTTYYDVEGARKALGSGKTANKAPHDMVSGMSTTSYGGVFTNQGTLKLMLGKYINNHAESYGGSVLFNFKGTVNNLYGYFIGNNAKGSYGGAVLNFGGTINNIEGYFLGNTNTTSYGGAISNASGGRIDNIVGDFIGNKAKDGAAIFVYDNSSIGSIIGDFIGNVASGSGVIYSTNHSEIDNIVGDFIGNTAGGGMIYTNTSKIKNIDGNFIGNNGTAIYNQNVSSIENIAGNFTGNRGDAIKNSNDGVIGDISGFFNDNTGAGIENVINSEIGTISGVFTNNRAGVYNSYSTIDEISGIFTNNNGLGAIANVNMILFGGPEITKDSEIGKISGTFTGNSIDSASAGVTEVQGGAINNSWNIDTISGTFTENYAYGSRAYGGAINNGYSLNKIENSVFNGNYASSSDDDGSAFGGAIYSTRDLYLESNDGFDFSFQNNYVQIKDGDKDPQAIYLNSHSEHDSETGKWNTFSHTLTLNAIEDAKFSFYDGIAGRAGYANLALTSDDGTGTIDFYNYVTGFDATLDDATVNLKYNDDRVAGYEMRSLVVNSGQMNLEMDVNADNGTSDTLRLTDVSNGTINVSDINFLGNATAGDTLKFKVLDIASGDVQLALNKTRYVTDTVSRTVNDTVGANVVAVSNDMFRTYSQSGEQYNAIELATSDGGTTNDSLSITYGLLDWNGAEIDTGTLGDTLALWNQTDQLGADKSIDLGASYTASDNVGASTGGVHTVNGDAAGGKLNLGAYTGFELANATTLNLNNLVVHGDVANVSDGNAAINLKNVTLDGDILATAEYALGLTGDNDLTGATVNMANATMCDGTLTVAPDTFANASLTVDGGTLDMTVGGDYVFDNLVVDDGAMAKIALTIDAISTNTRLAANTGAGKITVESVDWGTTDRATLGLDWTLNVLDNKTPGAGLTLALSDTVDADEFIVWQYAPETSVAYTNDEIAENATFDDVFMRHEFTTVKDAVDVYAKLTPSADGVALALTQTHTTGGTETTTETDTVPMGDTLKLWAENDTDADKSLIAGAVNADYAVVDDAIDSIKLAGRNVSITGADDGSNINLNNAVLGLDDADGKDTVLNLKNIALAGNADAIVNIGAGQTVNSENSVIAGRVYNDGAYVTDIARLNHSIAGTGKTTFLNDVVIDSGADIDLGQGIVANGDLDIGGEILNVANAELNGKLKVLVNDIAPDSDVYAGGKLNVANTLTLGSDAKMQLTVAAGKLQSGESTAGLLIVSANNTVGDWAGVLEENLLYDVAFGADGLVYISKARNPEDLGTNDNEGETGGAFEDPEPTPTPDPDPVVPEPEPQPDPVIPEPEPEPVIPEPEPEPEPTPVIPEPEPEPEPTPTPDPVVPDVKPGATSPIQVVKDMLNELSQHDFDGYRRLLHAVAPTDSQVVVSDIKTVNNAIGRWFEQGASVWGQGRSGGDVPHNARFWFNLIGNNAHQDDATQHLGFDANTVGAMMGVNNQINRHTRIGLGYMYHQTKADSEDRDVNIDGHTLFAHAKYRYGNGFVRGTVIGNMSRYSEDTQIMGLDIRSDHNVYSAGAQAFAGWHFPYVTPELGLEYTRIMHEKYQDSLGQDVNIQDSDILTAIANIRYTDTFHIGQMYIRPMIHAGVSYDVISDDTTAAVQVGNANYTIRGARLDPAAINVGGELMLDIWNWGIGVGYNLDMRNGYIEHTGSVNIRYNF